MGEKTKSWDGGSESITDWLRRANQSVMNARSFTRSPKASNITPCIIAPTGEPASELCIFGEKIVSLTESNQVFASRTVYITFALG